MPRKGTEGARRKTRRACTAWASSRSRARSDDGDVSEGVHLAGRARFVDAVDRETERTRVARPAARRAGDGGGRRARRRRLGLQKWRAPEWTRRGRGRRAKDSCAPRRRAPRRSRSPTGAPWSSRRRRARASCAASTAARGARGRARGGAHRARTDARVGVRRGAVHGASVAGGLAMAWSGDGRAARRVAARRRDDGARGRRGQRDRASRRRPPHGARPPGRAPHRARRRRRYHRDERRARAPSIRARTPSSRPPRPTRRPLPPPVDPVRAPPPRTSRGPRSSPAATTTPSCATPTPPASTAPSPAARSPISPPSPTRAATAASTDLAQRALSTERTRFPGSKEARTAAFLLGRLADDQSHDAAARHRLVRPLSRRGPHWPLRIRRARAEDDRRASDPGTRRRAPHRRAVRAALPPRGVRRPGRGDPHEVRPSASRWSRSRSPSLPSPRGRARIRAWSSSTTGIASTRAATERLRGELAAAGFVVVSRAARGETRATTSTDRAKGTASRRCGSCAARRRAARRELWVSDRLTGKTLVRRVDADPERAPRLVAMRGVELLRASLLELESPPHDDAPPATPALAQPPPSGHRALRRSGSCPPRRSRSRRRPLAPARWIEHAAFDAGIAVLASTDRLGPAAAPKLGAWLALPVVVRARVELVGPAFQSGLANADGTAVVRQELATVDLAWTPMVGRTFAPFVALGGGPYHLHVQGTPSLPGYQAASNDVWAGLFAGSVGLGAPHRAGRLARTRRARARDRAASCGHHRRTDRRQRGLAVAPRVGVTHRILLRHRCARSATFSSSCRRRFSSVAEPTSPPRPRAPRPRSRHRPPRRRRRPSRFSTASLFTDGSPAADDAGFCYGSGPVIPVPGANTKCTGDLGATTFLFAVCSCHDVAVSGQPLHRLARRERRRLPRQRRIGRHERRARHELDAPGQRLGLVPRERRDHRGPREADEHHLRRRPRRRRRAGRSTAHDRRRPLRERRRQRHDQLRRRVRPHRRHRHERHRLRRHRQRPRRRPRPVRLHEPPRRRRDRRLLRERERERRLGRRAHPLLVRLVPEHPRHPPVRPVLLRRRRRRRR